MLIKQAGPGLLPLTFLFPEDVLKFLRTVEQAVLDNSFAPVFVYWSRHNANRLLPNEQKYRELMRDAFSLAVFSEEKSELDDEWCFLVESQKLCLIACGQQSSDPQGRFQCVGSLDPHVVRQSFVKMLPMWQSINFAESNRLEDARNNLGQCSSSTELVELCRESWPLITPPSNAGQLFAPGIKVDPLTGLPVNQAKLQVQSDFVLPILKSSLKSNLSSRPNVVVIGAPVGEEEKAEENVAAPEAAVAEEIAEKVGEEKKKAAPEEETLPSIIPPEAQQIIRDIIGQLRQSHDLSEILQLAIERLVNELQADRGLIWQIVGDEQLAVTNEVSSRSDNMFVGTRLGNQESTAVVMDFLSRFPYESATGVISIPDTKKDTNLHKMSPTLSSLVELGEVRARLVAQLRSQGVVSGFLELQQCKQKRQWGEHDASIIQSIAEILSVVVKEATDQARIEADSQEKKLINEIAALFRESSGQKGQDTLAQSVRLVADHMGFVNTQIYLYSKDESSLIPQISDSKHSNPVDLSDKNSHFVSVFESGRGKVINAEYSRKGDSYFGHDSALVVPLVAEGETLGVLGLWERVPDKQQLTEHDQVLALTIAGQLVSFIRADQAIAQIRADQAREVLINRITNELRESWKDIDRIIETLLSALKTYFGLAFCVVSLWDGQTQDFSKTKTLGSLDDEQHPLMPNFGEQLFLAAADDLKAGNSSFLTRAQIIEKLAERGKDIPPSIKAAQLVPLVHGGNLRATLCLVSNQRKRPYSEKDMKMLTDLAERVAGAIAHAELFEEKERQAITDPMTGLFNRRHFGEQLSKEIDRWKRHGHPFSYIITDLDYLKKINDTLGHQFGDLAIKHIASIVRNNIRDVDTAARYGGEEFVVLLPVTDIPAARLVAERICAAIREKPVEGIGVVTASIGVATYPDDAEDRDALTEIADQALYLAKHRGRNQVCSASADLLPSLQARGEEALEVQKATIKHKAEEMANIDLKLIAEHGILGILGAIIKIIEARDAYSNERSPRAAEYAGKMANSLKLSKDNTTVISLAAILHNVGKIALPEEILQKKGPLTEEERKIIETSPAIGAKILEPAKHLHKVASVIENYHEHWDGSGYPKGIKGEEIPLESRIIALVDAYIAMTSDRPYRSAMTHDETVAQLKEEAGTKWDPRLVKIFLSLLEKDQEMAEAASQNASLPNSGN
jgi:diguanylate cyclase (GGDEF)-like protein